MSHPPSAPVKVPASAATYTPATLDPELRSQINTVLLREGYITKIQEQLLHSLDAHPSNWPSAVQTHALALLRSGEASTFPALVRRVLEDVRHDTATARAAEPPSSSSSSTGAAATNNNNNTSSNSSTTNANASADGATSTTAPATSTTDANGGEATGAGAVVVNGNGTKKAVNGGSSSGSGDLNLAVPAAVLETVLKLARESLEAVCQLDEGGPASTTNGG
ncbi:hypothetical protein SLS62_009507 [Diatrype stigma]|uniref:Uncharacterized protein n=1 Tax=Diatrype stigma TaxID=117547 RepID=A0AAN9UED6_9PEZI